MRKAIQEDRRLGSVPMMTDLELIMNEKHGSQWESVYANAVHFFDAPSEREAKKIAKEYGIRFGAGRLLAIGRTAEVK